MTLSEDILQISSVQCGDATSTDHSLIMETAANHTLPSRKWHLGRKVTQLGGRRDGSTEGIG